MTGYTLAQLETLLWIARLGSFNAAARRLNLTQPTVSLRISQLEAALGATLFERQARGVRLTQDGARLLDYAERYLTLSQEVADRFALRGGLRGLLRLGAPDSFALICLAELMRLLEREYPELKVAVTVDNSSALAIKLNRRELDVAFLSDPELESGIRIEPLGSMELAWVASPLLSLPDGPVGPPDLAALQVITNPEPSKLLTIIRRWFAEAGLEPARLSTCNSLSVIAALTQGGVGASVLPVAILEDELASGALRRLETHPAIPLQRIYAAYPAGEAGSGMAAILRIAREVLARTRLLTA